MPVLSITHPSDFLGLPMAVYNFIEKNYTKGSFHRQFLKDLHQPAFHGMSQGFGTLHFLNSEALFHGTPLLKYTKLPLYIYIYGSVSRAPHGMVPPLPPYLIHFAHATVAKRTFPHFCMHAAVAKRTFSFCWMNPPAGFGGSIARNCGEMQILSSRNCSAQCTGHFNAQQMESYTYTYPCTYTFININNYICKNIYVYLYIHICTYPFHHIHIHIDIFIYT